MFYNYKGYYSIILFALVDADYKFIWADIGTNGSASDAQIFNDCQLKQAIDSGVIGFPPAEPLPADNVDVPYFLIGDDAFALRTWLMKPFSLMHMTLEQRIFNYRLSRARRIVENAFGILANRFGCLLTTLKQPPDTVDSIVQACLCLHNFMRMRYPGLQNAVLDKDDEDHNVIPGAWKEGGRLEDMHEAKLSFVLYDLHRLREVDVIYGEKSDGMYCVKFYVQNKCYWPYVST